MEGSTKRRRLHKVSLFRFPLERVPVNVWQRIYQVGKLNFGDWVNLALTSKTMMETVESKVPWEVLCLLKPLSNVYKMSKTTAVSRADLFHQLKYQIFAHWCCCCMKTYDEETLSRTNCYSVGLFFPACVRCARDHGLEITYGSPFDFWLWFPRCRKPPQRLWLSAFVFAHVKREVVEYEVACFEQIISDYYYTMNEAEKKELARHLQRRWSAEIEFKLLEKHFVQQKYTWYRDILDFIAKEKQTFRAEGGVSAEGDDDPLQLYD